MDDLEYEAFWSDLKAPEGACGHWGVKSPEGRLTPFKCGHRGCSSQECRRLFWWRRVRLIADLVTEYQLDKFFTLTLDPELFDKEPWTEIQHVWSKFRKRMSRRTKAKGLGGWKFVAVLESHKTRKWPHIHGFTDFWMAQADWSSIWYECCGGKIVWVEKVVDIVSIGDYVGKQIDVARYVGKQSIVGVPSKVEGKTIRTLWRSKYLKSKKELTKEEGWCIIKERIYDGNGNLTWYGRQKESDHNGCKTK